MHFDGTVVEFLLGSAASVVKTVIVVGCMSLSNPPGFRIIHPSRKFCRVSGAGFIDPFDRPFVAVGFNLGGYLCWESTWWNAANGTEPDIDAALDSVYGSGFGHKFFDDIRLASITLDHFKAMQSMGVTATRVPIASWLVGDGRAYTYIDRLLEFARLTSTYLILDMHTAPGCANAANFCSASQRADLWTDPANQQALIDLWIALAGRYRTENQIMGFDVLNEPSPDPSHSIPLTDATLKAFYIQLRTAIRGVDKNHILFWEGNNHAGNSDIFLDGWHLSDPQSAPSFHVYAGTSCPPPATVPHMKQLIEDFANTNIAPIIPQGRPYYIGEYGGDCDSWIQAATEEFQVAQVRASSNWLWQGIRPSDSGSRILRNLNTTPKADWNTLINKLGNGQPFTQAQYDNGIAALAYENWHFRPSYEDLFGAYFDEPLG